MIFQKELKKAENAIMLEHKELETHKQALQKQLQSEVSISPWAQGSGQSAAWMCELDAHHTSVNKSLSYIGDPPRC